MVASFSLTTVTVTESQTSITPWRKRQKILRSSIYFCFKGRVIRIQGVFSGKIYIQWNALYLSVSSGRFREGMPPTYPCPCKLQNISITSGSFLTLTPNQILPHAGNWCSDFYQHKSGLPVLVPHKQNREWILLSCLAFSVSILFFGICPCCCMCVSSSFCFGAVCHCINIRQFVYPFYCWWTFGWFPDFGIINKAAMNNLVLSFCGNVI